MWDSEPMPVRSRMHKLVGTLKVAAGVVAVLMAAAAVRGRFGPQAAGFTTAQVGVGAGMLRALAGACMVQHRAGGIIAWQGMHTSADKGLRLNSCAPLLFYNAIPNAHPSALVPRRACRLP